MLATVVLVQLQLQSAQMHSGGHPACPCIDPWSVVADDPRSCRELNINRELHFGVTNGTAQCVPLDYGASVCQLPELGQRDVESRLSHRGGHGARQRRTRVVLCALVLCVYNS